MKTRKILTLIATFVFVSFIIIPYGCKKSKTETTAVVKNYAWAVGNADSTNYGMILFTSDGGNTWIRKGQGSGALLGVNLFNVYAVDTNTVWVVGSDNSIVKTADGGNTWTRIPVPATWKGVILQSISLVGSSDIWISGAPGRVYNSTNSGTTWTMFDTTFFHNGIMQGIYAINSQTVYVVGGINLRGFIARTQDGGQTWDSIVLENNYNRHEWIGVKASDANHIVIYGGQSHYSFSTDAGVMWTNDSLNGTGGGGAGADINCLTMLNANTWWGAFDFEGIYITTNSGATWTEQTSTLPGGMYLFGIDYFDRNHAIIVAASSVSLAGKIMNTSNGGNLWVLRYLSRSWINKVSVVRN
jgi:photosystem II stability/assembly factor-like uncharacterized protein